eukprot:CAMPEP_0172327864 /NCGR_PEP_ID=MMETSP1058-20130122/60050_1 /TAXON_ID=83371 /ORGANISM="Detonula confervacea, Strain CCMP 353" /LENGTH=278 /DNA_ID=CAMNT_0013044949 /DNA_START=2508 /DNA_END=3345 /DNA_ORIENTATION=-
MMKLTILSAAIAGASAFAPSASVGTSSALRMSEPDTADEPVVVAAPVVAAINGWVADPSLPCYGLPGSSSPLGFFDPVGFSKDKDLNGVKRLREAEIMHGRVAMMATIGYIIGENTPTIAYGMDATTQYLNGVKRFREAEIMHGRVAMMATIGYIIGENTPTIAYGMDVHHTIGNNQIPEVPGIWLFCFFLAINVAEAARANIGWMEPGMGPLFTLREKYYPGDIGFDPFGLKPENAQDFANMQTKELNNGRLAMFAAAGMCVQEQINGQGILENLGF